MRDKKVKRSITMDPELVDILSEKSEWADQSFSHFCNTVLRTWIAYEEELTEAERQFLPVAPVERAKYLAEMTRLGMKCRKEKNREIIA